jgi:hypothetical protein
MHAMRAVSIIAVLLLLVANALELLPAASPFEPYLSGGVLVLGLVALVTILAGRGPERDTRAAAEAARHRYGPGDFYRGRERGAPRHSTREASLNPLMKSGPGF